MTDAVDAAIAKVDAIDAASTRMRMEIPMRVGINAILDIPLVLTAADVANLFIALAKIVSGEVAQQAPAKGSIATPGGIHVVR